MDEDLYFRDSMDYVLSDELPALKSAEQIASIDATVQGNNPVFYQSSCRLLLKHRASRLNLWLSKADVECCD